ncbi:ACP S-malonyltransferase [Oceanidesulfovibrio marinus]|uniref:Malonyl CoA-acyl carrier protein transacylase n=1 Tax=Oceanidesulfovibrio marinus TaxID=370038 RepID=A0A6P1ZIR0_9BACT|nr:ACP S-malonyltransferase [Oceanidesulfovibrio marinus]TVM34557.1 malonyl CoA-ACP transacylase [Oceanidesulfovibrio marinus]
MNPTTTTALLFPGQGSQEPGMGRSLAEASSDVMDLWKKTESAAGAALREIYWDGDAEAMAETRYLQPALTVVNISVFMALEPALEKNSVKAMMTGHSLGEFSALAAARVLSLEDVVNTVALRGRLMAEADPEGRGAMAAVLKLDQGAVEELVREVGDSTGKLLVLANRNSPSQYVVSGEAEAVDAMAQPVKERKGRLVKLPVSGAFHSPLMQEAANELAGFMKKLSWGAPRYPVYFNVTAGPESDPAAVMDIMCRQMISPVRYIEIVDGLWQAGARQFLELGPKTVLAKLTAACLGKDKEFETQSVIEPDAVRDVFPA